MDAVAARALMNNSETPFFFLSGERRLFGVWHASDSSLRGAFVFCHPFAEEKLWAHRACVSFARELAARGYAVLRFDMSGHGDSDGEFAQTTIETHLSDIARALDEAAARVPAAACLGLLGLRLGGSLAALAAERDARVARLILWDPVVDGAKYSQEIMLANLAMQMAAYGKVTVERTDLVKQMEAGQAVNIDGYEVSYAMFRQITEIRLDRQLGEFNGDCLIAQIDRAERPPRKEYTALAGRYRQARIAHAVEQPFWKEIKEFYGRAPRLSAITQTWLDHPSVDMPKDRHAAGNDSERYR